MKTLPLAAGLVALSSLVAGGVRATTADSPFRDPHAKIVSVDVAEDGTGFVFDEAPVFDDGAPAYGNLLVTQGYRAEVGAVVTGAITGGSGPYATARGEAAQELLGFNNPGQPTTGINKTITLEVRRP